MCGIAGLYFDSPDRVADQGVLEAMVRSIRHRGPDGTGFHIEPGVGLAHARLSIIDLEGGAQPIHNEDRSIWISFNGEIFNYVELRQRLVAAGHRFYTNTDTEVIVHLYEEQGEGFLGQLNGQFAIALWDRKNRKLLLARDRAGILPLYYARYPGGLVFASETKAIFASRLISAAPDPAGLDELMTFWAPIAPRTAFLDVLQVAPGELLTIQDGRQKARNYWTWSFPDAGEHVRSGRQELQHQLHSLLSDATSLRLRADVPVGAYLSGGLDSSSLVALLQEQSSRKIHTFSLGFNEASLDETEHQHSVASFLKTEHHHVTCTTDDIARSFPAVIEQTEQPVLRAAPAPMRLLSALVRQTGIKVVLTGEGADEVLGGYDIFKEAKVRQFWARNPGSQWRFRLLQRLYPYMNLGTAQNASYLKEFFGSGLNSPDDPLFSHFPRWATTAQCKIFWSDSWREQVTTSAIERLRESLPAGFSRLCAFNRAEFVEARTLLPGYLLASQGDRMLMANSIEGRFPFLDHRLIEFGNRLDPRLKMRVLREKYLLKETMRDRLPPSILGRFKQPYRAPDAAAFLSPSAPDYVNELLGADRLIRYGYFDPKRVGLLINKLRRTRDVGARENMAFLGVLSTQVWHARFIDGHRGF